MLSNNLAISTLSLGQNASHALDTKIRLAAHNGFSGIEVVYSDLENYCGEQDISMIDGAEKIRKLCQVLKVEILSLAPFENFEGRNSPLKERLATAQHWIGIARMLKATYLQVPALYVQDCTGDEKAIVSEMQQLSDLGTARQPTVGIAYEPMSWSTHYSTWESALQLAKAVDRVNFGLCMDSFHIITKLWASPYNVRGKYHNADQILADSLSRFVAEFPADKLFYVQLSDGEMFDPPFSEEHEWYVPGEAAEFTWSKHARPFPLENELGGYMPVIEFLKACVVDKGYTGWVSMEVFDRQMRNERYEPIHAINRATVSWQKLNRGLRNIGPKL